MVFLLVAFTNVEATKGENMHDVFVVFHAWHSGIVIEQETWKEKGGYTHELIPETTFIEFGWGDGKYYPSESFSLWRAIRAILWPTSSVLHVSGYNSPPDEILSSERVHKITITEDELDILISEIKNEFIVQDGEIIHQNPGIYHLGQFFEASSTYHLFRTCNVWTAQKLRNSGLDMSPWRSVSTRGLGRQLESIK